VFFHEQYFGMFVFSVVCFFHFVVLNQVASLYLPDGQDPTRHPRDVRSEGHSSTNEDMPGGGRQDETTILQRCMENFGDAVATRLPGLHSHLQRQGLSGIGSR
jgi:hypothetical protein